MSEKHTTADAFMSIFGFKRAEPKRENPIVYYKGVAALELNGALIEKQGLSDRRVEHLKQQHIRRLELEDMIAETESPQTIRALVAAWHKYQYLLQETWGFERNKAFHRSWYLPKCVCPKMDNDDRCPSSAYIITQGCPIHDPS